MALFDNDEIDIKDAFNAIFEYFAQNKNNIKQVKIDNDYGVVIDKEKEKMI